MERIENPPMSKWSQILQRPTQKLEAIEATVSAIFSEIESRGDVAVAKYTQLFDGVSPDTILVSDDELDNASRQISEDLKRAIKLAYDNINRFHIAQKTAPVAVETQPGVHCWQEKRPIEKVGLYIPGGSAPLFSTILMLAIPASIAGCSEIILCTPPAKDGTINPAMLYTAQLCGVRKIYKVGGIQAIGAMTFGTTEIPKVYKIFGPGNQYVTVAKQLATKHGVAIDMPAGPSELLVFADETANPAFVASDLLSQAEHGADSQVILVTTSRKTIDDVTAEIEIQLSELPREEIARKAMANSKLIFVSDNETALRLINEYGPEHFIVVAKDEQYFVENILNAGSVFIGNYTPESAGDYASGTNHTLPTNGYAKQYSGVNLDSFNKSITFQKISAPGLELIGGAVEQMAEAEGLQAHKNAVSIRLRQISKAKKNQ
ncbi:MAG: histidinol dehydrogenase [Flavobacteriaceae bacterium]|nr:histidinol dehydrogenase [Flavobacteriaceae bacterium]